MAMGNPEANINGMTLVFLAWGPSQIMIHDFE